MSLKWGTNTVSVVTYNNNDVKKLVYSGSTVWCKPFVYTTGTLPSGVASLTCKRSATSEPTASTGTISNNGTIYYEDSLYWTAEASTGYNVSVTHGSSNPVTVSGNVNGVSASGVSASIKTYSITVTGSWCSITVGGTARSSGWSGTVNHGTTIVWTSDSNHSFGGSSTGDTRSVTVTGAGIYSNTPNYVRITVDYGNCSVTVGGTSRSSGWSGIVSEGTSIVATPNSYYSFDEGTTQTSITDTAHIDLNSYTNYFEFNPVCIKVGGINGTNCTCNVNANYYYDGYYVTQEWDHYQLQWTANSGYQFSGGATTQRITNFIAGQFITATATAAGAWQELYPEWRGPTEPYASSSYTFETTSGIPYKGFGFFFAPKTKPTTAGQEFTFVASEMAKAVDNNVCAIYNIVYSAFGGGSKIRIYYRIFRGNALTTPQMLMSTAADEVSQEINVSDLNNATSYANRVTLLQVASKASLSFYKDGTSGSWDSYKFVYYTSVAKGCTNFYITKVETFG